MYRFRQRFYNKIKNSTYCSSLKSEISHSNRIYGVYMIVNIYTWNCYIGCGDIWSRWHSHISALNKGNKKGLWQEEYNKYGLDAFEFLIIGEYSIHQMSSVEKFLITFLDTYNNGYNLDKGNTGAWKKHEYRIVRGQKQRQKYRYKLINPESQVIVTSVYLDVLQEYLFLLQNNQITEQDAVDKIKKISQKRKNYKIKKDISIDNIIDDLVDGLNNKEIRQKYNISKVKMQEIMKEKNITWHQLKKKADFKKIKQYDEKYNIKKQLLKIDKTILYHQIGCYYKKSIFEYCKQNDIKTYLMHSKSGVRFLYFYDSRQTWIYQNKYFNINKQNKNLFLLKKMICDIDKDLWIITDEEKYQKTINKARYLLETSKTHRKKNDIQSYQKKALKVFRQMFNTDKKKIKVYQKPSKTGITYVKFDRANKAWLYRYQGKVILRKNIKQLQQFIQQKEYPWIIEDEDLFKKVEKEVQIFYQDLKKPIEKRTTKYQFI